MERTTPHPSPVEGHHYVYFLHAEAPPRSEPVLVYVGVTSHYRDRMLSHSRTKWWWQTVVPEWTHVWEFPTRDEAERAEYEQIIRLRPALNHPNTYVRRSPELQALNDMAQR